MTVEYEKMGLVTSEVKTKWKTLKHYPTKKTIGRHGVVWSLVNWYKCVCAQTLIILIN